MGVTESDLGRYCYAVYGPTHIPRKLADAIGGRFDSYRSVFTVIEQKEQVHG